MATCRVGGRRHESRRGGRLRRTKRAGAGDRGPLIDLIEQDVRYRWSNPDSRACHIAGALSDGDVIMQTRKLGPLDVSAIGLGCMGFTASYGGQDEDASIATL